MAVVTLNCGGGGGGGGSSFTCTDLAFCSIGNLADVDLTSVSSGSTLEWVDGTGFVAVSAGGGSAWKEWFFFDAGPIFSGDVLPHGRVALAAGEVDGIGFSLGTEGTTTTSVRVYAGGTQIYSSGLYAGVTSYYEEVTGFPGGFSAGDAITVVVNTAGVGAADLGVQVQYRYF